MKAGFEALCMIPADSSPSLADLRREIERSFERNGSCPTLAMSASSLELDIGGWTMRITHNTGPYVAEESKEIVERFGSGRADREVIAASNRRFEVGATLDMDHFNDFVLVLECIEHVAGAILFDPNAGEFM